MKTLLLHGKYDNLSPLAKEDEFTFRRLLKGGRCQNNQLYITPVELNSTLICKGFAIEHHQLVYSKGEGKLYMIFRPIQYQYRYQINHPKVPRKSYSYYRIVKFCYQPDYIAILLSHYCGRLLGHEELKGKIQQLSLP